MAREPVLEVRALDAGYGDSVVLHGVHLDLHEHEVVAVLGPNGAGKSTVLKAVCGIADVHAGSIRLGGTDIADIPPDALTRLGVGYVPQLDNVFPTLTVAENLEMGALGAEAGTEDAARERVLRLFPVLEQKWKQRAAQLSGGQRQMVAMGRALMASPRLLLLDEPSAGLAPNLVGEVFAAVRAIAADGVPILLVEQNASRALEVSDRGYVLENGRNRYEGASKDLLQDDEVARLYLGAAIGEAAPASEEGKEEG